MMRYLPGSRVLLLLALLVAAPPLAAAQQPLPELSLEELMTIDAGRVFGASERIQPVTEAPASVSFITAEEIARYGYRSLADILRGVRGLYVTNDRNFSFLGARGFGKPGDYNSRILLLVNGHRVNDNVYGQAEIGTEFGLDPAMFERVEIIRGPASSLYGDSAFFAVVNVITKSGASLAGGAVSVEVGSLGTRLTRGSIGHRTTNGLDIALSATYEGSNGVKRLYFPAYDAPATNNGVAEGLDGEGMAQFYTQASLKNFRFTGAYGRRRRDVPTASYFSLFNSQEPKQETTDRHTLAELEYLRPVGRGRLSIRGAYDRFTYDGIYPFAPDTEGGPVLEGVNSVVGARWSIGTRFTHPLPHRQVLTVGVEFIDNVSQNQGSRYIEPAETLFTADRSSTQSAVYVQDEVKLASWLIFNGGVRYDKYWNFERVTPRTAVIVTPSAGQSFKYLYGQAFRAPNAYELNTFYFGSTTRQLRPESINTHEFVWERYTNDWLRTSMSTYWYKADRLITLVPAETFLATTFVNEGEVQAKGLELEAQMRLSRGLQGVISYALQEAHDVGTGVNLANSPHQMGKVRMSIPGPWAQSFLSMELRALSSRRALGGTRLGATATTDVTLLTPLGPSLELTAALRNLFNSNFSDPVSENHLQDSIQQNGRTFRIGLRWKLWTN